MCLENITYIMPGAFNCSAFKETKILTMSSLQANYLDMHIFSGLNDLKTLNFYQLHSIAFPMNWLSAVSETLENLLVYGLPYDAYDLMGLTSGVAMVKLKLATFSLNLKSSINEKTFRGLVAIQTLDLTFCGIESIGPMSFDPIATTIRLLKLNNNKLKHLPEGLFAKLLPSSQLRVYLSGNPFDCSCTLVDFQNQLRANMDNFAEIPTCATPFNYYNRLVHLADDICWNGTDPSALNLFVKCFNQLNQLTVTPLQRHDHQFRLWQSKNNSVMVNMYSKHDEPLTLGIYEVCNVTNESNAKHLIECSRCEPLLVGQYTELEMMHLYTICIRHFDEVSNFDNIIC